MTVEQTIKQLRESAKDDVKRAEGGVIDMNPYSTSCARSRWLCGFRGETLENLVEESHNWTCWMRGKLAAEILKEQDNGQ